MELTTEQTAVEESQPGSVLREPEPGTPVNATLAPMEVKGPRNPAMAKKASKTKTKRSSKGWRMHQRRLKQAAAKTGAGRSQI